ncbi:MAG: hypothetical protein ACLSGB_14460 [Dorea sp.]
MQRDISQMCCIPKQTVNPSIRKLEQDRYLILERKKASAHIHLTEKWTETYGREDLSSDRVQRIRHFLV